MGDRRFPVLGVIIGVLFVVTLNNSSSLTVFFNWVCLVLAIGSLTYYATERFATNWPAGWLTLTATLLASFIWAMFDNGQADAPLIQKSRIDRALAKPPIRPAPGDGNRAMNLKLPPLQKDHLLRAAERTSADYAEALTVCHQVLHKEMAKFVEWELVLVRPPFETYAPRGRAMFVGVVFKTKLTADSDWILWDQTWFVRGGKLIADFDTAEFGSLGAVGWCFQQEAIQNIYGPK